MKKNILFATASLLLVFASCKKDEPQPETPAPTPSPAPVSYMPMTEGSYWVYDNYQVDANNVATYWNTDSVYVSGDTVINGNTYQVFGGTWFGNTNARLLRESSGMVIDDAGNVHFAATLDDTLRTQTYPSIDIHFITKQGTSVTVPAGTYASTLDIQGHVYVDDPTYAYGTPRISHEYYSQGIGMVKNITFYVMSPGTIERRLVSYHIAP